MANSEAMKVAGTVVTQPTMANDAICGHIRRRLVDESCLGAKRRGLERPNIDCVYSAAISIIHSLEESLAAANLDVRVSRQHTICAVCLVDKHTPVRCDALNGYVCVGCLEKAFYAEKERSETAEAELASLAEVTENSHR